MIKAISLLKTTPTALIKNLVFCLWLKDARFKLRRIQKYLSQDDRILDIGAGTGSVCTLLKSKGYGVTPLDVEDRTLTTGVNPVIYDGKNIPFPDNSFDTVLILTVLHHTQDPEKILSEAKRVGGKIVIIEDIYTNVFQKYLTYIFDSLFNLEFIGHPHTNKSDGEWKGLFRDLGLTLVDSRYDSFLFFFKQATYRVVSDSI